MNCEQAELRMAELLAGEISAEERAALDRHLLDCAACRGDFELARAGARVEWADVSVPREAVEATLASFHEAPRSIRLLRWATAAAAVFAVATLLLSSTRSGIPSRLKPVPAARTEMLAMVQDAAVGAMLVQDEDGRPVGELGLRSHEVSIEIVDGIAKTTVEENFENHTDRRLEGSFQFPLPSDASISRLALEVNGKIEEGTCLERDRAREVFEGIVRRMKDPALLEWQPGGFFKCRVFPIEPRATKRVIVAYTQALPFFKGRMTYVYPLASEKTRTHPPGEVRIDVKARFSGALAKIESPSHRLDVQRRNANEASMSFRATQYRPNNDFVVTMEPADEEVRVVAHKPDDEDGYFACFATPRGGGARVPARYAFVLDASASISAPRLEVARRLVRAMMERGIPGDRFEVFAHNVDVQSSGEVDLRAANTFMDALQPIGGSDVLKALLAAGEREVIYIGKGAPTFGETDPGKILEGVKGRKIRTIAVGSDANGVLLERLGGMMRVNPNDEVAKRVAEIAETLGSPVLSGIKVEGEGISDVVGARDLFYGERLVVAGRFRGTGTTLRLSGQGWSREVVVTFPAKEDANNYIRRLWAQRKVSDLLAQGPDTKAAVTDLGVKYQIMTPYTSFLVLENEQMWKDHQLKREVQKQDKVEERSGKSTEIPDQEEAVLKPKRKVVVKPPQPTPFAGDTGVTILNPEAATANVRLQGLRVDDASGQLGRRATWADGRRGEGEKDSMWIENGETTTNSLVLRAAQQGGGEPLSGATFALDTENSNKAARINDLQRILDGTETLATRYEADMQVYVRQLEVQLAQIQELTTKVDEHRSKLAKSLNEKSLAVAELQYARQLSERLQQDLGQLEEKHVEMAREKKHLEEKLNSIQQAGGSVNVAPKKALEAKITAVSKETGLVVISIGKDDGVLEGDEFTVFRGGDFVAKIVINRTERKWAAGKIVLRKLDPRLGDDVSNHIFVAGPRAGSASAFEDAIELIRSKMRLGQ